MKEPDDEVARLRQRVKELEEYKRRVELSIKASSAFMDDEVIRRKQAEALRWAATKPTKSWETVEKWLCRLATAIEKGEVEI